MGQRDWDVTLQLHCGVRNGVGKLLQKASPPVSLAFLAHRQADGDVATGATNHATGREEQEP